MRTGRTRAQRREQAVALLAEGSAMSTGLAALLLSVSPKTVARWCREGTIKAFRPGGDGQWRVNAADIAKRLLRDNQGRETMTDTVDERRG
jgi:excisionase family DNA binding protein